MNNNISTNGSKRLLKGILIALLAAVVTAASIMGGIALSRKNNASDFVISVTDNGGAVISETENKGVTLMSKKIARAMYASNGISETADNAYSLTATIIPDNATDKTVDWAVAFVNPSSTWASGKTVTDYATITPASDGALSATLTCLQAFGEQIKVAVTSRNNANTTATCTLDYAQKITGASLAFGNITCVGNGDTDVIFDAATSDNTIGGAAVFTPILSEVYTVAETYDTHYTVTPTYTYEKTGNLAYESINLEPALLRLTGAINGSEDAEVYFDLSFFTGCTAVFIGENVSLNNAYHASIFISNMNEEPDLASRYIALEVKAEGTYSSYTYKTNLVFAGQKAVAVNSVQLSESSIVVH